MTPYLYWKQLHAVLQSKLLHRALLRDEAGSSLVEFALSISLVLMVICGIMGLSLAVYADHFVALAAEAATRYAAVRGSSWTSTCASASATACTANAALVQIYVQSTAPGGITSSNLVVQTTWPGITPAGEACFIVSGNNSPGCMVQVTVNYSFNFLLPFLPTNAITLSSTGALPITH